MRLIDIDQTIFVPIIDESKGGVKYEMQMTVAEVFDKFFDGVQPETVEAIPVEWLSENIREEGERGNFLHAEYIKGLIWEWHQEGQEVQDG